MEQNNQMIPFSQQALHWAKNALFALGSMGLMLLKTHWAAIRDSHPWSLYQAVKDKDTARLQVLLNRAPRFDPAALNRWRLEYLEYEDILTGWSPLMVGAHGGSSDCVQALLSAGASHSHTDRWERTALHLAVTAGEHGVAPGLLLLHSGADPFVEDCKGFTPFDLALNNDSNCAQSVQIRRMIENRAYFAGWVNIKVVRLAGWRRVWEPRWLVVSPRRRSPSMSAHTGGRSSASSHFVVLNWFRSLTGSVCGKAWLNGAEAHMSEHDGQKELTLTLEREHDPLSDAFVVTDRSMRHSFFIRAAEAGPRAGGALDGIAALVQATNAATDDSSWMPSPAQMATSDAELAQRLQEEENMQGGGEGGPSSSQPSTAQPQPSAPSWPTDLYTTPSGARTAQQLTEEEAQGRVISPEGDAARYSKPPMTEPSTQPPPSDTASASDLEDDNLCIICCDNPSTSGFLHGSTMHKCVCRSCAIAYVAAGSQVGCPMCRQEVQQVVLDIF